MFVSLTKMMKTLCGFKLGFGIRITKKNAPVMLFVLLMVLVFQMTWYMFVMCFWLMYVLMYCLWKCITLPFKLLGKAFKKGKVDAVTSTTSKKTGE